mmetsp:Transcript_9477/g.15049  ORF Transcript_9477/g.15049 Transcript_9477/m.15049 type:complete len:293 (-) Transcript_9477:321-1199(-)
MSRYAHQGGSLNRGDALRLRIGLRHLVEASVTAERLARKVQAESCQAQRVLQQHGDGHRAHSSRHRRDERGHQAGLAEVHVAHQPMAQLLRWIINRVDSHIDDDAAGLQPVASHHLGLAQRGNQDVRLLHLLFQVLGTRVAHGHCGIHGLQQRSHWHSDDVRAAKHHCIFPTDFYPAALQHLNAASWSARHGHWGIPTLQAQIAYVQGREAIHILAHLDHFQGHCFVHVVWQGELNEDSVHRRIVVELCDFCEKSILCRVLRQGHIDGVETHFLRHLLLAPNVRLRILPHAH